MYYVVGGGVLNSDGIDIYTYYTRANVEINFDGYLLVEFSGALGALSFYVSRLYHVHVLMYIYVCCISSGYIQPYGYCLFNTRLD